jgi:hypothetical protein
VATDLPHLSRAPRPGADHLLEPEGAWTAGLALTSYGCRIGVRTTGPALLAQAVERLPPGWRPADSPRVERLYSLACHHTRVTPSDVCRLWVNGTARAGPASTESVLDVLESDLQLFVAEMAHRRVFIHAGVVGWHGGAVLIPGRSHSGKTTLVAALVRAGALYYSDEYAVVDGWGRVHPYPRRLAIRSVDGRTVRCLPDALGGRTGIEPLPVRLVAVMAYRAGGLWEPRSLSPGRGVLALLAHTVPARREPGRSLRALRRVVRRSPVVESERGEAAELVPALLALCGTTECRRKRVQS